MLRKIFVCLLIAALIVMLAACGGQKGKRSHGTEGAADNRTSSSELTGQGGNGKDTGADGSKAGKNADSVAGFIFPKPGQRPYAVMIDNEGTRCLPQGGLDKAQLVYEIIVEGGETRLMPVFWNTEPRMIGPVRSARHYFLDYAMEHDAYYIHYGWSPAAKHDIERLKIDNINGISNGGWVFWDLTDDINNWQDSYTSMSKLMDFVNKTGYRKYSDRNQVFSYEKSDKEPADGQNAVDIGITYSGAYSCGYTYDEGMKAYMRFRKGAPQIERMTGKQLAVKNIIIQYVRNNTIKGDREGRQELHDVGSGEGWFVTCGKALKIKWSKQSRDSATEYFSLQGGKIILNPGQTWIQVVPVEGTITIK